MAGIDKPEFAPLLAPGLHDMGVEAIERLCVLRFPDSITRRKIMQNLGSMVEGINRSGIRGEVWVDGSFLTQKLNPDDADVLFTISTKMFHSLSVAERQYFDWFRSNNFYESHKIDNYGVVISDGSNYGDYWHAYWLRQFGFSRKDELKGIVRIAVPFVVTP